MLALGRRPGDSLKLFLADGCTTLEVKVLEVTVGSGTGWKRLSSAVVRIGIDAPQDVRILRSELTQAGHDGSGDAGIGSTAATEATSRSADHGAVDKP